MAVAFTRYANKDVGTSPQTIMTVGASTQSTLIGMSIANTSVAPITFSVYFTASGTDYYLIKNCPIAPGASQALIGGEQKVVLITGDVLKVVTSANASADVITSMLNTTPDPV